MSMPIPISISLCLALALPQDRFHWTDQESGARADLLALDALGGVFEHAEAQSARATTAQVCWVAGAQGTVLRTADGLAWTRCDVPAAEELDLVRVHAKDALRALVVSAGSPASAFVTEDGGATWSPAGAEVVHDFSAARPPADSPSQASVRGPRGTTLLEAGPDGSRVSQDRGATWIELDPRPWNAIAASGEGFLWAVGPGGRIARLRRSVETAAWNRFRGPNGTGLAEGDAYPSRIGPATAVSWSREFPPGHSSPILTVERIYLTGVESGRLFTYALDRATGATIWRREAPRPRRTVFHAKNHSAAASAAVDGDVVVVFFDEYGTLAYDHDGFELWRRAMGPFNNVYGMGASPILVDDAVIVPCDQSTDSYVVALHKETGAELWRQPRPDALSGHCTPVVRVRPDGGKEVLLPGSYLLDAYDAASGERLWWVAGLPGEMKSVPVLLGDRLWIHGYASPLNDRGQQIQLPGFAEALDTLDTDGDGRIAPAELTDKRVSGYFPFFDLVADGLLDEIEWDKAQLMLSSVNSAMAIQLGDGGAATEPKVLWQSYRSIPQLPSPLIYGGVYYLLGDQGGLLTTLDPSSGETLERGRLADAVDAYFTSPVAAGGFIYLTSESGILSVLSEGGGLEPIHTARFDDPIFATPALEEGWVYLRTASRLFGFGDA